jgi:hypothetical protein
MLSTFEKNILDETPLNYPLAYAYAVWEGREGIEFGPVRFRSTNGEEATYDVSPFPGAWTRVPVSRIIRVRHAQAM